MLRPMCFRFSFGKAFTRNLGARSMCGEDRLLVERMNGQEASVFRIKGDTCESKQGFGGCIPQQVPEPEAPAI